MIMKITLQFVCWKNIVRWKLILRKQNNLMHRAYCLLLLHANSCWVPGRNTGQYSGSTTFTYHPKFKVIELFPGKYQLLNNLPQILLYEIRTKIGQTFIFTRFLYHFYCLFIFLIFIYKKGLYFVQFTMLRIKTFTFIPALPWKCKCKFAHKDSKRPCVFAFN